MTATVSSPDDTGADALEARKQRIEAALAAGNVTAALNAVIALGKEVGMFASLPKPRTSTCRPSSGAKASALSTPAMPQKKAASTATPATPKETHKVTSASPSADPIEVFLPDALPSIVEACHKEETSAAAAVPEESANVPLTIAEERQEGSTIDPSHATGESLPDALPSSVEACHKEETSAAAAAPEESASAPPTVAEERQEGSPIDPSHATGELLPDIFRPIVVNLDKLTASPYTNLRDRLGLYPETKKDITLFTGDITSDQILVQNGHQPERFHSFIDKPPATLRAGDTSNLGEEALIWAMLKERTLYAFSSVSRTSEP